MKEYKLLFVIICLGIISAAELFVILTTVSPQTASQEVLWTFFLCLFLAMASISSLLWHSLKQGLTFRHHHLPLWPSLRQASLFSLVVVLGLFFKSLNILSIWDMVPLAVSAVLIEFFFQADKTPLSDATS